ncbi:YiiX/YebB-like N1pC/P60 family cysteine hydrolase [Hoeflea sp. G2-23]|uniref:YiiX/YebB-like N1pC/P60 family cysteine hydrolase n=2 Tax=Hoeflea algicola TaxID=2983763 RepID=A0ABT3ZC99_9HYPH|nr:YiiX/YebB-like N1pC/P60 family cysteine hydrolase [Hoeflea algicola]MCY0149422.1 YiiX/YebB-like N1pC/P60 family cysteine hydrolase [Hoeflea algicola]
MTEARQMTDTMADRLGRFLARQLQSTNEGYEPYTPSDPATLSRTLEPGDVLLVEGNQKISAAIKYLTQSTWSHAALYIGDVLAPDEDGNEAQQLIEVNLGEGCVAVPLSKYTRFNTRICRPVGLTPEDRAAIVSYMVERLGVRYDMKHIFDLLRYFLPTPPVPVRWRRRMLAFGSGDPTRAICSSMIAQAFQEIRYPILPEVTLAPGRPHAESDFSRREILHIRHHSLYAPRDFDLSPYFRVVKPTLEYGFDYKRIEWGAAKPAAAAETSISTSAEEIPSQGN